MTESKNGRIHLRRPTRQGFPKEPLLEPGDERMLIVGGLLLIAAGCLLLLFLGR